MKLNLFLSIFALLSIFFTPNNLQAQKNYDMTFIEIGIGQRFLGNVPTDVLVNYDTTSQSADFGKGRPALFSLGFVILPEEKGFAGCFAAEGMAGRTSSIGFRIGAGYKFGDNHFSVAPMLAVTTARTWNKMAEVDVPEGGMLASRFNPDSESVYMSPSQTFNGISGEDVGLRVINALIGLRPMCYVSYRVSQKITLFSNVGVNINLAKFGTSYEATGIGYESFEQFLDEETPDRINTPINDNQFLTTQNGTVLDKSPLNYTGFVFQFGIGITGNNK